MICPHDRKEAMPTVTDTPDLPKIDLEKIFARNHAALDIIAGFSAAMPTLDDAWHHIETALTDNLTLAARVALLRTELTGLRLDRANLAAAALAAIAAWRQGEHDPWAYLLDELTAQGFGPDWGRR
jgi:hypothetical protein